MSSTRPLCLTKISFKHLARASPRQIQISRSLGKLSKFANEIRKASGERVSTGQVRHRFQKIEQNRARSLAVSGGASLVQVVQSTHLR